MIDWMTLEQVEEELQISQTKAYSLKDDRKIANLLGRPIQHSKQNDKLVYSHGDIQELKNHLYKSKNQRIITLMNHKGGVSKSVSTLTLGHAFAEKGYRVLLIDTDAQCNLTRTLIHDEKGNQTVKLDGTLFSLFERTHRMKDIIYQTKIDNLSLIPSSIRLAELPLFDNLKKGIFRKAIDDIKSFDLVLIDTPPSISDFTMMSMSISTDVLIPLEYSPYAIDGLIGLQKAINIAMESNSALSVLGVFAARVNKRYMVTSIIRDNLPKGFRIFKTEIPESTLVTQALMVNESIIKYDDKNPVSLAYKELAEEIENVIK